jgi:hypothetical protein
VVVGEARVREKLGRGGQTHILPFDGDNACCSTLVAPLVGASEAAGAESEAEGMTRWRVGASPRALQNSRTVTLSPDALIRPEVKMTPDWRSAKTGSALSATEALTARRGDCDVRVSGLGVVPVYWSPRIVRGRKVVRGD